tara:strand:- start:897 stop:1118 length:222 start_codon:yes stop_codon:yes gene_type:complete
MKTSAARKGYKKKNAITKIGVSKTTYTGTPPNPLKSLYQLGKVAYKGGKKIVTATKKKLKSKAKKKTYTGRKI